MSGISKAKEDVETPISLLNERRIEPNFYSRRQMVLMNMNTPPTASTPLSTASAVSRQPHNFFSKYPASNGSSYMSLKTKTSDQSICSSTPKISRPVKKRKQSNQLPTANPLLTVVVVTVAVIVIVIVVVVLLPSSTMTRCVCFLRCHCRCLRRPTAAASGVDVVSVTAAAATCQPPWS